MRWSSLRVRCLLRVNVTLGSSQKEAAVEDEDEDDDSDSDFDPFSRGLTLGK